MSGLPPVNRSYPAAAANRDSFWRHVDMLGDCWEWTGARSHGGYGKVGYGGRSFGAHRCSWELSWGPIPDGLWVLHKCDNPPCVNPAHLFLGDAAANTQDMLAKGRGGGKGAPGESNRRAALTEQQVLEIRLSFASGEGTVELSKRFPVTSRYINRIIRGDSWPHVGGPLCTEARLGRPKKKAS